MLFRHVVAVAFVSLALTGTLTNEFLSFLQSFISKILILTQYEATVDKSNQNTDPRKDKMKVFNSKAQQVSNNKNITVHQLDHPCLYFREKLLTQRGHDVCMFRAITFVKMLFIDSKLGQ